MEIDDLVDQIAFGRATPKVSSCLGLYLSPETIYIADTHMEKDKPVVDHLVRIPVPAQKGAPAGGTGTLNTDFLADNTQVGVLIRQSMSQVRWNSKDVMVTLSHHLGLLRYFTMPSIDRRFWRSAVPLEAKKYIPIPFDALSHDFQVVPLPPDASQKERMGALVAVTQQKNLANITSLLEALGLNLVGMEVAPCSALRLWETLDRPSQGRTHAQVHFDGGNIRILVADRGLPVFFRELFLGGEASVGDLRKIDLAGCVGFAQKNLGVGPLTQLRVSGSASNLPQWQEALGGEVGAAASIQDTAASLGIKGGDWGGFAAIGASLRFAAPSSSTLDLGRIGQVGDDERRTARNIIFLGAGLAAYFTVMGLFGMLSNQWKSRELNAFQREPEIEGALSNKSAADIEQLIRQMQVRVSHLSGVDHGRPLMTVLLRELVDALPDRVWFHQVRVTNPLVKTASRQFELAADGHAMAPTLREEQDLAFLFRDNLAKSAGVGKLAPELELAVTARPPAEDESVAMDPEKLQRLIEQRTSFSLKGKPRSR